MREMASVYAPFIERYLSFKESLGYKSPQAGYVLGQFDRFCEERGEVDVGVTRELAEEWGRKRANESDPTRYHRVSYLIQLASFLNDIGYPSFVPRPPANYKSDFTPHIFSHEELGRFFPAIDEVCAAGCRAPYSCAPSVPYIMRFLYGTGARIGEAVSVKGSDVDLEKGTALLRATKNGKDRIVPMSGSLAAELGRYASSHPLGVDGREPFFRRRDGMACSCDASYEWFRKGLRRAGIPHSGGHRGPRMHDLRHTFAVHSLAKMADEGLDLYYSLPILSTYLGHQSLEATDKYVRLTADMYPGVIAASNAVCQYVFPEAGR